MKIINLCIFDCDYNDVDNINNNNNKNNNDNKNS